MNFNILLLSSLFCAATVALYAQNPDSNSTPAGTPIPAPVPPIAIPPPANDAATLTAGKTVYQTVCVACHQPTGLGLPPVYPPLKDSDWVSAPKPGRLVRILLHGAAGPITVNGKPFNMIMPPHGPSLNDGQIAAVLTYIRHEWGGQASSVSAEYVAAARQAFKERTAPWTESELKTVPDR